MARKHYTDLPLFDAKDSARAVRETLDAALRLWPRNGPRTSE